MTDKERAAKMFDVISRAAISPQLRHTFEKLANREDCDEMMVFLEVCRKAIDEDAKSFDSIYPRVKAIYQSARTAKA